MRIVVDTGVLGKADVLRIMVELPYEIVVPSVVVAERARQLARDGRRPAELLEALAANDMIVEALDLDRSLRYAPKIHDDERWAHLARDALIAGHVDEESILWTTDVEDFLEVGVPEDRIFPVGEA